MLLWLLMLWGGPLDAALSYQLELQESVTVQEGLCVHVPCTFSYPWFAFAPPYMSWFQKGADVNHDPPVATNRPNQKLHERTQGRFFLHGDLQTKDCSLDIKGVNMGDSGTYFFQIFTYSYLDNMLSLNVTALTHTPDILIPGTLESGRPGNLTCSVPWACERGTPPIFSWTSVALTSLGPRTHFSSVLTLTPRPQDHGTNLTCQVYFPAAGVMVERTVQLNVTYAPQNTAIRIFQGNRTVLKILQNTSSVLILEGQALRLLCAADSSPPAELSWFRGSPAWNATPINRSANLDLPQVGAAEEGDLTCQAQNPLGSQHVSLHLSVVYPPRLLSPSCSWEGEGLHCNCSSRAQPAPTLRWRLGEGLLEGNHSNASWTITSSSAGPWANSSLSLSGPLGSSLRLSCEARNAHGSQSAAFLLLPGTPEPRTSGVLGAVGGAGSIALLSLCLCLFFRVKTCRKKAAQPVQSMDMNPASSLGSGAHQHQSWTDSPADHPAPADASPISREEQELHYALLRFPKLKPQKWESIHTEYTEIKAHK
ncbi:PREDICTED: sialic acid-binding Ig-like lectin 5 [Odobenus rosmarus divergens]|uniref:Sialic acid-binding Ig-like lectin 5 n=1 Tax=Odobenus rosmarus divergens TaxID=9708 RepID=A0A2U3WM28_ODORO|nr:PREDICTED: sialic acid-binding Ig-like lectin 5 [Odobenus rosmarus divergens]